MNRVICVALLFSLFVACDKGERESVDDRFTAAVVDASRELTTGDLYDGLVSLRYEASPLVEWRVEWRDTLLKVATLQSVDWKYGNVEVGDTLSTENSTDDIVWVTIPGEITQKLSSEAVIRDSVSLNRRLIELLGLRPEGAESVVNILWVDKADLLRPSYNPDITTTCGDVVYPADDKLPSWYKEWFEANIAYSYESPREGLNYPFTRLGYTYDWGAGRSRYGLSEFITVPRSRLIVERRVGCWSYYQDQIVGD